MPITPGQVKAKTEFTPKYMSFTPPRFAAALIVLFFAVAAGTAFSQSSLFNIPTTDVMGPGAGYAELDFDAHLRAGGFRSYGFAAVYGVHKKLEIGLNGYLVNEGGVTSPFELQPNLKWQVYESEAHGLAVSTGAVAYIPVSKKAAGAVASIYAVASKQFKGKYAPRFTGGGFSIVGPVDGGGKLGVMVGYEQPMHRRLTFISDWRSGKNRFGYLAAGFGVTLTKKSFLYTAWYFGNEGRGNNSFGVYYGFTF